MITSQSVACSPPLTPSNPFTRWNFTQPMSPLLMSSSSSKSMRFSCSLPHQPPLRCAILGAGFAGLSVAWHLLQNCAKELPLFIDIFDDVGIGGGASGVAAGLLHPYSPKVKPLWRSTECWSESLKLVQVAESAWCSRVQNMDTEGAVRSLNLSLIKKRGILRPAVNSKNLNIMDNNAQNCLASCRIESIDKDAAVALVPGLSVPLNLAFYMPEALNIHCQHYLEALYLACQNAVTDNMSMGTATREMNFWKKSIYDIREFAGEYNAVVVCLGARAAFLTGFGEIVPLRLCRGVVARMELSDNFREEYPDHSPSILSDAWLAVQGPRNLQLGSTWEWGSTNHSRTVSDVEASRAVEELLPKASAVYPMIKNWTLAEAVAGLRGMPPLTSHGSLPLLGCVDDFVGGNPNCQYWIFAGLGAKGLYYHALLGKLMAQAILSRSEDSIPSELLSWKQRVKK
ncbi:OLC1v1035702C1 [Oldenlandia corymbosa var. corymbosa]|uniref:OLC1v1035702C1 n=1 Tax=Oldenlandia corymbosa var. corymbosa TaxID=529605 RepID=A0AAV1CUS7_OLDCO|nr:OLC1v1035702C1 [Oldenlandia corymbosa var. corymbosa]